MNIRSVGPALYLASQAATKDGWLDFVCVREEDRSLFMEYLDARLAGRKAKFPLPLRRSRIKYCLAKFDASLRRQTLAAQNAKGEEAERNRNYRQTSGAHHPASAVIAQNHCEWQHRRFTATLVWA